MAVSDVAPSQKKLPIVIGKTYFRRHARPGPILAETQLDEKPDIWATRGGNRLGLCTPPKVPHERQSFTGGAIQWQIVELRAECASRWRRLER